MATAFAALHVKRSEYTKSSEGNTESKKNIECYFCHKKGHYKSECKKRLASQEKNENRGDGNNFTNQALTAEIRNLSQSGYEDDWLADSAASKHMTSHRGWFIDIKPTGSDTKVQIGDNSFVQAEGIGSIQVMALVQERWEPRTLEDTLHVPKLEKNLFSIGAVTNKNFKVVFEKDTLEIRNNGNNLIATGIKQANQCYKMLFRTMNTEQANSATVNPAILCHERMGHMNFQSLREMADAGRIPGLKITSLESLFCESCQYGKLHQKPFKDNLQERAKKPGEHIHSDVCGKISTTSIGGADYFVLFKDDCTSYRFAYFITHKNDVFSKFLEFEKLVEKQTGNKIKVFRSDNGGEFVNHQFQSHLKAHGIIHETSTPYTAAQNGRAERDLRSIVESAGTMLTATDLPRSFRAEAVNTAVYILNRRPCKPNNTQTPFEKWTGKELTLTHIKKFGATAYAHTPKQFRSKFENKSKNLTLIGYDGYSTNYRLYDKNSGKVIVARDVIFNEENIKGPEKKTSDNEKNYSTIGIESTSVQPMPEQIVRGEEEPDNIIEDRRNDGQANDLIDFFDAEEEQQQNVAVEADPPQQRRVLRDRATLNPPDRYVANIACAAAIIEPQSYQEAMKSENAAEWQQAMNEEIASLKKNNTWTLQSLPSNRQPVGCT